MPYQQPTLTSLIAQALQDIAAGRLTGIDAFLRRAVLPILGKVVAQLAFLHYDFLGWCFRQAVPFTAEDEFLVAWAGLKGVTRLEPTFAKGPVTFPATNGYAIPAGFGINRSDGVAYVVTAAAAASGNSVTVTISATVAGSAGNAPAGAQFRLANPLTGITSSSSASGPIVGGTDVETDDDLRARMLAAYAAPPHGGDRSDYIGWARAVPGVTRAWLTPQGMGPGTVVVYVMLDLADAAEGGFPQGTNGAATNETRAAPATGDQLIVANAIYPVQPVTALVYVSAPTAAPVDFTIANLGANNTAAMQAAITAALTDMFLRLGNVGGSVNPDGGGAWPAITENQWNGALNAIPGLTNFTVTAPVSPITPAAGALPVLGTIAFSA